MSSTHRSTLRLDQLPRDALRSIASACIPNAADDTYVKVYLRSKQAACDFRTAAAISSTCSAYRRAVKEAAPSRFHFVGPPVDDEHAAVVLGVCRLFGRSIRRIVLERVPDLDEAWSDISVLCPELEEVLIYRCPADSSQLAMTMRGLEYVLAHVGGKLKRLRFCGISCSANAVGRSDLQLCQYGGTLLKHLTQIEQLVIDVGWFEDTRCNPDAACACHPGVANWSATGIVDVAAKVLAEDIRTKEKLHLIARSLLRDGEETFELAPFTTPYSASDTRKTVYDALRVYVYWMRALLYSAASAGENAAYFVVLGDWLNPVLRGVCCFVES